ncbi:MAG: YkgJ family cysteine cluster protein [Candidatus Pacearchaeota archaeon]|jgi:Fe-S-cluster containining protein
MKFECKCCGTCCRIFKDVEKGLTGLPLFEWEKEELENIAKEKGIKLNIQPTDLVFDKRSGFYICGNFSLKHEPCPFLVNNKCSIYEHRPLVCKAYPLVDNPLYNKDHRFDLSSFMKCQNFDFKSLLKEHFSLEEGKPYHISQGKLIKEYSQVFGEDILINATIHSLLKDFMDKEICDLIKNNDVKLRKVSKLDYSKYTPSPFFEFLTKIGKCDENEKKVIIHKLTDYQMVKDAIEQHKKSGD